MRTNKNTLQIKIWKDLNTYRVTLVDNFKGDICVTGMGEYKVYKNALKRAQSLASLYNAEVLEIGK